MRSARTEEKIGGEDECFQVKLFGEVFANLPSRRLFRDGGSTILFLLVI
jgi:hypothetical protein